MRLAAVGSNCIDYYNNIDGGKAFPGGDGFLRSRLQDDAQRWPLDMG